VTAIPARRLRVPLGVRLLPWEAERAWFTPSRPRAESLKKDADQLAGMDQVELVVEGVPRPGYSIGEGRLVVLAHGWGGRAAQMVSLARGIADAGFRAVAVDAPGHGSDHRPRSSLFAMESSLRAVADHFGQPEAVVAHSLGALSALLAFAERPPRSAVFLAPILDLRYPFEQFKARAGLAPWTAWLLNRRIREFSGQRWASLTAPVASLPNFRLLVVHDPADADSPISTVQALIAGRPDTEVYVASGLGHHRLLRDRAVIGRLQQHLGVSSEAEGAPR